MTEAQAGPLASTDLATLEATLLPSLERHHLRLLAHCLRTLQQVAGSRWGPLPARPALVAWVAQQGGAAADPGFQQAFLTQLERGALQLQTLATSRGCDPLALDISDLIVWAEAEARARLNLANPAPPPG
ncbi:hypothetical protein KQ304_09560 [Synechococcus sp. CS-1329]|jgi:hypothetical protein|uniref:hypothetical protein n=1 Tax=Synechococcus sp. CS-1329 TaxID=2847975 RepID=UPI00223B4407|nr:hypothetical protein [Synechococcus sp. CS-1329]MCT0219241.1 hypothetical protein [Synechococcus sp. CS-1329]